MDLIEAINDGLKKLEQEKAKDGFVPSVILREDEYRRIFAELEKKDSKISALQMEHEYDVKMIDEVKGEAVKLYNEIEQLKIAGNGMDLLLKQKISELEKKDKRLNRQFKMIQKRDREIEELKKDNSHQWEERCRLTFELEEKDSLINTMQAEFERLEDLEDNTDMLKMELKKKDKIINEMAKTIYDYASLEVVINCPAEFDARYNMDLCKMNAIDRNCLVCIKEYFKKKVEE